MKNLLAHFKPWQKWSDRKALKEELKLPGVYLLAEFSRRPTLGKPALSRKIFYIGETCGTLHHRLYSFHRSAFEDKFGHSGGATYFNARACQPDPERLYVSVLPVDRQEVEREAYIRYVERALLWQYYQRYKEMPACNRK